MIALKGGHFSKFPGKTHYSALGCSKLKVAHPVNYFPRFVGKNIKNCPPSKLLSFTSLLYPRVLYMVYKYTFMDFNHVKIRNFQKLMALLDRRSCNIPLSIKWSRGSPWTLKSVFSAKSARKRRVSDAAVS